jgi:hypothetical protein
MRRVKPASRPPALPLHTYMIHVRSHSSSSGSGASSAAAAAPARALTSSVSSSSSSIGSSSSSSSNNNSGIRCAARAFIRLFIWAILTFIRYILSRRAASGQRSSKESSPVVDSPNRRRVASEPREVASTAATSCLLLTCIGSIMLISRLAAKREILQSCWQRDCAARQPRHGAKERADCCGMEGAGGPCCFFGGSTSCGAASAGGSEGV